MRRWWLGLAWLVASAAAADPGTVTWSGRVLDSGGAPVNGTRTLTFRLYEAETGGAAVGSPIAVTATLSDGFASARLPGWAGALATADGPLWLEVSIDGAPVGPRSPMDASPYAVVGARVMVEDGGGAGGTCAEAGAIRWDQSLKALRVCDGAVWHQVGGGLGLTDANPARSCKDLRDHGYTTSGLHWIDPDGGDTADAVRVYCDQATDGGGWTVCLRFDFNTNVATRRFDGTIFRSTFGSPGEAPAAYGAHCTDLLRELGPTTTFDLLARTHVVEADQWQWVGPLTVSQWTAIYDTTTCAESNSQTGAVIAQCKGSATGGATVDVSSRGYRMGWHTATGGSCTTGTSVNQFALNTNESVILELNYGYNYGHATYLHFDCNHAASHPCNAGSVQTGVNNVNGTGAGRLLVGQPGASGPDCGPYDKDLSLTRPTVSFAFRER